MGVALFHAERQTDRQPARHDEENRLSQFCVAPTVVQSPHRTCWIVL